MPTITMPDSLNVETTDSSIIIRFIRPEIRNPLSIEVLDRLHEILDREITTNRTIIFTGTNGIFASGADLREIANVTAETAMEFSLRGQSLFNKIAGFPQTTTAAINGYCFGGALDLALSCNVRIASPNAEFCHPGANLGIITGWGGTQRLPRLVGQAKALEMFFTCARLTAAEALSINLIDEIVVDPLENFLSNSFLTADDADKRRFGLLKE